MLNTISVSRNNREISKVSVNSPSYCGLQRSPVFERAPILSYLKKIETSKLLNIMIEPQAETYRDK